MTTKTKTNHKVRTTRGRRPKPAVNEIRRRLGKKGVAEVTLAKALDITLTRTSGGEQVPTVFAEIWDSEDEKRESALQTRFANMFKGNRVTLVRNKAEELIKIRIEARRRGLELLSEMNTMDGQSKMPVTDDAWAFVEDFESGPTDDASAEVEVDVPTCDTDMGPFSDFGASVDTEVEPYHLVEVEVFED